MNSHPAIDVAVLVVATALLWKGAEWLVLSSARVARRLGMSDLTIGLTVVALGTSAPEFLVTVIAAFQGEYEISVGNVVGSNIFNTGLILGLCSTIWLVPIPRLLVRRDVPLLLVGTALVIFFGRDGELSRLEGLVLFGILASYIWFLVRRKAADRIDPEELPRREATARDGLLLLAGLACVCAGAYFMVHSATALATALELPKWLIGVTIVAGGTSLPEFATAIMAGRHGHTGIVFGNLVGSDLFNLLGVLGLAAFLHPIEIDGSAMTGLLMMLGAVGLLLGSVLRGTHVPRSAGVLLIVVALSRWAYDVANATANGAG